MKNASDETQVVDRKEKYKHYAAFRRKNNIIRNIEIIVVCIIAIIAAVGIYGLVK